jgi:TetR/AcrR family transcriptional repressor of nem operon
MSRPRKFDEQAVVTRAMLAFLEQGYEATSLSALEEATGVDRKGLYNTFGDKEGLFIAAVERWIDTGSERHIHLAETDGAAFAEIVAVFDFIVGYSQTDMGRYGCLVCNSVREPISQSPRVGPVLQAYLTRVQSAFQHALGNEMRGTGVSMQVINQQAHVLVGTFVGAFVLARTPLETRVMVDFVEVTLDQLRMRLETLRNAGRLSSIEL